MIFKISIHRLERKPPQIGGNKKESPGLNNKPPSLDRRPIYLFLALVLSLSLALFP